MSHKLHFQTIESSESHAIIAWHASQRAHGRMRINWTSPVRSDLSPIMAQILAARAILFERNALKQKAAGGAGVTLFTDQPLLKMIIRQKVAEDDLPAQLVKLIWPFKSMLAGLSAKNFNPVFMEGLPTPLSRYYMDDEFDIAPAMLARVELFGVSPLFGKFEVTLHAIERYVERGAMVTNSAPKRPFHSLIKHLTSWNMALDKTPEKVKSHSVMKYIDDSEIEVWKNPGSSLHFKFLIKGGVRTLVTCFIR
jgi:hypothetical protein